MKLVVSVPVVVYVDCAFDVDPDWDQDERYDLVMRHAFDKAREFCKSSNLVTDLRPTKVPEVLVEETD